MSLITKSHTFSAGATIIASEHNTNFDTLYNEINGSLTNANISNSAAIAYSKLNLVGGIVNADISASAAIVASKLDLTSPGGVGTTAPAAGKFTTLEATSTLKLATTNQGDILYDNGTSLVRLTPGTSGYFLKTQGAGANPVWAEAILNTSFSAYNSADQTALTTGAVKVTWDTEDFDTSTAFASSTFTAPATGKYLFTASVEIFTTTINEYPIELAIYKNGAQFSIIGGNQAETANSNDIVTGIGGSILMSLAQNDTVEIYVIADDDSGTWNIQHGATKGRFTGIRLS